MGAQLTSLHNDILAECFNVHPEPLTADAICKRFSSVHPVELASAVVELEKAGYLDINSPLDVQVLTPQGKRQAVKYAAAELLLKIAPEAIEFSESDVPDSMERRNGCVPQTDMPRTDAASAEESGSSALIMEALFPEIYATAKRCEDVCSFPDCGSLAHRTCPCGARTCFNHMYAPDASLADRNQMGFCRDCISAIQEEQAGIEKYGRTI